MNFRSFFARTSWKSANLADLEWIKNTFDTIWKGFWTPWGTQHRINIRSTADWGAQYTQSSQKSIYNLSSHLFLLILHWRSWTVDRRRQSSRVAGPARAPHSCRTPRWGPFHACGVSGSKRCRRRILRIAIAARLLRWRVLRIVPIARATRSECRHALGAGRPKSQLDPTSSDLAPNRCGGLIKCQHNF
jgi:hypothetical protein